MKYKLIAKVNIKTVQPVGFAKQQQKYKNTVTILKSYSVKKLLLRAEKLQKLGYTYFQIIKIKKKNRNKGIN